MSELARESLNTVPRECAHLATRTTGGGQKRTAASEVAA
jgi:hypothetical protein